MTNTGITDGNNRTVDVRIPSWINGVDSMVLGSRLKPDRARAILHQFFLAWLKNRLIKKSKKVHHLEDYFAVSSEILKEVGTKDYARYVDLLLAGEIIERRAGGAGGRCYTPGGHAQLYRWNSTVSQPFFRTEKIEDAATVKCILRTGDKHQKIDCKINGSNACLPVFETMKDFVLDTCISNHDVIIKSLDEINWFIVDDFGGRFHHRISSMPKEQRQYLRFTGQEELPLKVLDIRNSQPFFTALVSSKALIDELMPEFRPAIAIAEKYANKPDFLLYRELCVTGRLYEFFLEVKGIAVTDRSERDKIKELLFRAVIYCKKRVYGADKLFQSLFRSSFPSVFSFFSEIKHLNESHLPEIADIIRPAKKKFKYAASNDSHKILPCMMQRAESRMMYRVIAPKMIESGIRFITIHDSFMILPGDVKRTLEIIQGAFDSLGLPAPTLSIN